jgi:hypothetical protein
MGIFRQHVTIDAWWTIPKVKAYDKALADANEGMQSDYSLTGRESK